MQFRIFPAFFLFLTTVSADRTVLVLLNYGIVSSTSGSCTDTDFNKVITVVEKSSYNSTYTRRQLRTTVDVDDMTESLMMQPKDRRILWPAYCKNQCAGFQPRTCTAVGCKGYRRRNLLGEQDNRDLVSGASFTCTQQVDYINKELDKLVTQNQVSSSCKTLLSNPRSIPCFDDIIYGVVEYFKLWDASVSPPKLIYSNYTGQDIRKGQVINIEAVTNDCVDFLHTSLKGPNGYYAENKEHFRPFTLFANNIGFALPHEGQYEMSALPDGLLWKNKVIKFNVVAATVNNDTNNMVFTMWDTIASPNKAIFSNYTGQDILKGQVINIEAIPNDSVDFLLTTIKGPNGYSIDNEETMRPFSVFGSNNGVAFPHLGQYEMTAFPDGLSEKKVVMKFNVVEATVYYLKLWDTVTKTVLNGNFTGGNVCNSKTINIEAVMYSDSSKVVLTSTNGFSQTCEETEKPFSVFRDSDGVFNGKKLNNGLYTLKVYFNKNVLVKTIQFNVTSC